MRDENSYFFSPLAGEIKRGIIEVSKFFVMSEVINQSQVKKKRQKLRNNLTKPEEIFWYYIRKRQILGIKFRRQCSIGKYIVDFYSFEKKLAIE